MATRTPAEAQRVLQESGVSAAAVAHVTDLLSDPALVARGQIALLAQPGYDEAIPVTAGPTLFENLPAPDPRPAPLMAPVPYCVSALGLRTSGSVHSPSRGWSRSATSRRPLLADCG
ncbi:CoA transferase [Streptomyces gardneri]|nr:CoA transferase [Streptomyces gardneri]